MSHEEEAIEFEYFDTQYLLYPQRNEEFPTLLDTIRAEELPNGTTFFVSPTKPANEKELLMVAAVEERLHRCDDNHIVIDYLD